MEKENKGLIITIVVLVVCVFALGGYLAYDKLFSKKNSTTKENSINNKENSKYLNNNIDEKQLATQLWNIFDITDGCGNIYYFLKNDLNYNSEELISKNYLNEVIDDKRLSLTLSMLQPEKEWKENDCTEYNLSGSCKFVSYSKIEFIKEYEQLFGTDKKIENTNFLLNEFNTCSIENNSVICHEVASGNTCEDEKVTTSIISTNLNDNNFEITVEKSKNLKKIEKYKLTFKKDTNDNYYWVSTELIKDLDGNNKVDGEIEFKGKVTGYVTKQVIPGSILEGTSDAEAIFFNILHTDSKDIENYIKYHQGNSYVNETGFSIGCLENNEIIRYNSSDKYIAREHQENSKFVIKESDAKKILNSTINEPITLEIEKLKLTSGSGAPTCYSHLTNINIVD